MGLLRNRRNHGASAVLLILACIFYTSKLTSKALQHSMPCDITTAISLQNDPVDDRHFYYNQPALFVENFAKCLFDRQYCHVLYWHVQKTGGSFIASRLYYSNNEPYNSKEWCCNGKFMKEKFRKDPLKYCSMSMGVYEVRPSHYKEIVQTCQQLKTNLTASATREKQPREHRYLGLLSIREPIQRSLSGIHQRCNVHSGKLDEEMRSVCRRCAYSGDDRTFYDNIVNDTNEIYLKMRDEIILDPSVDIPLYLIDNEDLTEFFTDLETRIDSELRRKGSKIVQNTTFRFPRGKKNAEAEDKICNFGMPSSLMKQHQPALEAYHDLWLRV